MLSLCIFHNKVAFWIIDLGISCLLEVISVGLAGWPEHGFFPLPRRWSAKSNIRAETKIKM